MQDSASDDASDEGQGIRPATMVPVPIASSLEDIYTQNAVSAQGQRWSRLLDQFESMYLRPATFVARSPGRVNIIGEHIDYSLYSVLPMAIAADVLIAIATTPWGHTDKTYRVRISNVHNAMFPAGDWDIPYDSVDIDATVHEWTNYFKAGLRGALELLRKKRGPGFRPRSMQILMDGNVPIGGGLSSSAAFVSASALAVLIAQREESVDKTELTELAIVSERAVGVSSGGMDQSASVLSERGSALFVSFTPSLTARPVPFPKTNPELAFVIAQSFVQADKFVTAPVHYNLRVVECSMAAAYLNAVVNPPGTVLPADAGPLGVSLHGFHAAWLENSPDGRKLASCSVPEQLEALVALVGEVLQSSEGYTRAETAAVLGIDEDALAARFLARFPVHAERFRLRQRALHVFSEALRVLRFLRLLEEPGSVSADVYSAQLGRLMNETQDSCRDVYECSCPEIDRLCAIARGAGALGSRLTGAGWGGCSVHLVPWDKVSAVRQAWDREYYAAMDLTPCQRAAAVVVSLPGGGSAVYRVDGGSLAK